MRAHRADVKEVLRSARQTNLGGRVVALGGGMQRKENGQRASINYKEGQCVMCFWLPAKGEEAQEWTEEALKGHRCAILAGES